MPSIFSIGNHMFSRANHTQMDKNKESDEIISRGKEIYDMVNNGLELQRNTFRIINYKKSKLISLLTILNITNPLTRGMCQSTINNHHNYYFKSEAKSTIENYRMTHLFKGGHQIEIISNSQDQKESHLIRSLKTKSSSKPRVSRSPKYNSSDIINNDLDVVNSRFLTYTLYTTENDSIFPQEFKEKFKLYIDEWTFKKFLTPIIKSALIKMNRNNIREIEAVELLKEIHAQTKDNIKTLIYLDSHKDGYTYDFYQSLYNLQYIYRCFSLLLEKNHPHSLNDSAEPEYKMDFFSTKIIYKLSELHDYIALSHHSIENIIKNISESVVSTEQNHEKEISSILEKTYDVLTIFFKDTFYLFKTITRENKNITDCIINKISSDYDKYFKIIEEGSVRISKNTHLIKGSLNAFFYNLDYIDYNHAQYPIKISYEIKNIYAFLAIKHIFPLINKTTDDSFGQGNLINFKLMSYLLRCDNEPMDYFQLINSILSKITPLTNGSTKENSSVSSVTYRNIIGVTSSVIVSSLFSTGLASTIPFGNESKISRCIISMPISFFSNASFLYMFGGDEAETFFISITAGISLTCTFLSMMEEITPSVLTASSVTGGFFAAGGIATALSLSLEATIGAALGGSIFSLAIRSLFFIEFRRIVQSILNYHLRRTLRNRLRIEFFSRNAINPIRHEELLVGVDIQSSGIHSFHNRKKRDENNTKNTMTTIDKSIFDNEDIYKSMDVFLEENRSKPYIINKPNIINLRNIETPIKEEHSNTVNVSEVISCLPSVLEEIARIRRSFFMIPIYSNKSQFNKIIKTNKDNNPGLKASFDSFSHYLDLVYNNKKVYDENTSERFNIIFSYNVFNDLFFEKMNYNLDDHSELTSSIISYSVICLLISNDLTLVDDIINKQVEIVFSAIHNKHDPQKIKNLKTSAINKVRLEFRHTLETYKSLLRYFSKSLSIDDNLLLIKVIIKFLRIVKRIDDGSSDNYNHADRNKTNDKFINLSKKIFTFPLDTKKTLKSKLSGIFVNKKNEAFLTKKEDRYEINTSENLTASTSLHDLLLSELVKEFTSCNDIFPMPRNNENNSIIKWNDEMINENDVSSLSLYKLVILLDDFMHKNKIDEQIDTGTIPLIISKTPYFRANLIMENVESIVVFIKDIALLTYNPEP